MRRVALEGGLNSFILNFWKSGEFHAGALQSPRQASYGEGVEHKQANTGKKAEHV